jgi:hypothetical protein
MREIFGQVKNNKMNLSSCGIIAKNCWESIPDHFTEIEIDYYQVMPNYFHGI